MIMVGETRAAQTVTSACVSEGVQIGGGQCVSEGVQTNGGNGCVSEGVQTRTMVGETRAAQTAPTVGAGIYTQTARSESVAAEAQTVLPEPGVVVHTQTTATATTNMATGTNEEAGADGMDLVQVAPGPAPAPREVAQMARDVSSCATALDTAGPGCDHYEMEAAGSWAPLELVQRLREACSFVEGAEWRVMLQRSGREVVAAASALEEALPLALSFVERALDADGKLQGELDEARSTIAAVHSHLDGVLKREKELLAAQKMTERAFEEPLRELETMVQDLQVAKDAIEARSVNISRSLQEKTQLLLLMEENLAEMKKGNETRFEQLERAHAKELSTALEEAKRKWAAEGPSRGPRNSGGSTPSASTPRALNPFAANPFGDDEEDQIRFSSLGATENFGLQVQKLPFESESSGQRDGNREQRPSEDQAEMITKLEQRLADVEQAAACERARVEQEAARERRILEDRLAAVEAAREEERTKEKEMLAMQVRACKTESEQVGTLRAKIAVLQSQFAAVQDESRLRGEELDQLYEEHSSDLNKAGAAIAAAQAAAQFVKDVSSEAIIAELVHLRAELRLLKLSAGEGEAGAEGEGEAMGQAGNARCKISGTEASVDQVQHQLEELLNKTADSGVEVQELLERQEETETRYGVLMAEHEALEQQLASSQAECERLQTSVRDMELKLAECSENARLNKDRADELSRQNSQIVHKLQMSLKKKHDAESECAKAVAEAARHASDAAGAHCQARGLRSELHLMRQQYESFRRKSFSCPVSDGPPQQIGSSIDLDEVQKVVVRGDPEELENCLLEALDEIKWRRDVRVGSVDDDEKQTAIANETAAIRTEVLEMEVEHLTKEIVESRALHAAALHHARVMSDDLFSCAKEVGDVHTRLCVGLEAVLMNSEEDTREVLQQHKQVVKQLLDRSDKLQAAESQIASLEMKLKGKRSKQHEEDVLNLRQQLQRSEGRCQALEEEGRLRHDASLESIAMLSKLLEETQRELESCKQQAASSCAPSDADDRRQ